MLRGGRSSSSAACSDDGAASNMYDACGEELISENLSEYC
jgi:hypothetical protein